MVDRESAYHDSAVLLGVRKRKPSLRHRPQEAGITVPITFRLPKQRLPMPNHHPR